MENENDGTLLGKLLFWAIVAVVALVAIKVVFALLGVGLFLLFKLLPIVLVGWVVVKVWRWLQQPKRTTTTVD
jgi:hypothetical protein